MNVEIPKSEKPKDLILSEMNEEVQKRKEISNLFKFFDESNFDLKVNFNQNVWSSNFDTESHVIDLGTQKMPAPIKEKLFYLSDRFSDKDIMNYKYLHELSHIIHIFVTTRDFDASMTAGDLVELIQKKKIETGRNFSGLADLPIYEDDISRTQEDVAELLAIKLFDEEYYDKYIEMLKNDHGFKEDLKLVKINDEEADQINEYVEKILKFTSEFNYEPGDSSERLTQIS